MAKRKTKTSNNNGSKSLLYIASVLAIIALVLATLLAGYYLGKEGSKSEIIKKEKLEKEKRALLEQKLQESVQEQKSINERLQDVLKKESEAQAKELKLKESQPKDSQSKELPPLEVKPEHSKPRPKKAEISASHEIDDETPQKLDMHKRDRVKSPHKPKLSIIIDDVGTKFQVNAIKSLNLPLVISFLPPSKGRPHTPSLASKEENYMVHLPMEAQKFSAEEPYTLHVNDSQELISQRVSQIKKLFPRARYINNHTGSKFTSNEVAMNRLISALKENNMQFIDSRTTGQTKAPKVVKNFGLRYLGRDVFLDHHMDKPYILKQIKKAIKVAKIHGTAIAIGHPHKNTLQALRESKKLLQEVDLVFVDRL